MVKLLLIVEKHYVYHYMYLIIRIWHFTWISGDGKKREKKKKKKTVNIVNFDDNDSGTYSVSETVSIKSESRLGSDVVRLEVDRDVSNSHIDMESGLGINVNGTSLGDELDSQLTNDGTHIPKSSNGAVCNSLKLPIKRESSVSSNGSSCLSDDRKLTHSSFTSADFDFR